jgi:hypothetical protein
MRQSEEEDMQGAWAECHLGVDVGGAGLGRDRCLERGEGQREELQTLRGRAGAHEQLQALLASPEGI